jgi:Fe-S-cluster containining protein
MPKTCLCFRCPAKCCRYLALQVDTPATKADYDRLRWYLVHEDVFLFIDEGKWFVHLHTKCENLRDDNRCGLYETRPKICRDYSWTDCDFTGSDYQWEAIFRVPVELEAYARRKLGGGLPALTAASGPALTRLDQWHEISVFVDAPQKVADLEDLRWYVMHDRIRIRVDADGKWTLLYRTRPLPGVGHEMCARCRPAEGPADGHPRFFHDADTLAEYGRRFVSGVTSQE